MCRGDLAGDMFVLAEGGRAPRETDRAGEYQEKKKPRQPNKPPPPKPKIQMHACHHLACLVGNSGGLN